MNGVTDRTGTQYRGNELLELRLLGSVAVLRDGKKLELPASRKTRALLAYLAVTGVKHRRERLCQLLWQVPDDPRGSLRWSLSRLRSVIGEALVTDGQYVQIPPNSIRTDYHDLIAHAAEDLRKVSDEELLSLANRCCNSFGEDLDLARCDDFRFWVVAVQEEPGSTRTSTVLAHAVRPVLKPFGDSRVG